VPSGDPPDGTETGFRGYENSLFATWLSEAPVGGSPTGAGESLRVARATQFQNTLCEDTGFRTTIEGRWTLSQVDPNRRRPGGTNTPNFGL